MRLISGWLTRYMTQILYFLCFLIVRSRASVTDKILSHKAVDPYITTSIHFHFVQFILIGHFSHVLLTNKLSLTDNWNDHFAFFLRHKLKLLSKCCVFKVCQYIYATKKRNAPSRTVQLQVIGQFSMYRFKVCQVLLCYTSFAIWSQNCDKQYWTWTKCGSNCKATENKHF